MNEEDWEQFSELLTKILNMDGSYQEKAEQVRSNVVDETELNEFISWFQEE